MSATQAISGGGGINVGRTFLHPVFDYMVIGGGISLAVAFIAWAASGGKSADAVLPLGPLLLLSNYAHFAASTVRLYTKPGAVRSSPFLAMGFPAITLIAITAGVILPVFIGAHLVRLYVTWSPFHYSAQAYGLAVMYCYRSGCNLTLAHKRLLWWACMVTFFKMCLSQPQMNAGIWWVLPWESVSGRSGAVALIQATLRGLDILAFAAPAAAFLWLWLREKMAIPLIVPLLTLTNAMWFVAFSYFDAVVAVTVFHGLQYLAIVTIFHVKDKLALPGNSRGALYHVAWFYGVCLALGYGLFRCWPSAYAMAGYGYVESSLVVVAIVNIHHFIVDAFIWKLRKDPNYRIIAEESA